MATTQTDRDAEAGMAAQNRAAFERRKAIDDLGILREGIHAGLRRARASQSAKMNMRESAMLRGDTAALERADRLVEQMIERAKSADDQQHTNTIGDA